MVVTCDHNLGAGKGDSVASQPSQAREFQPKEKLDLNKRRTTPEKKHPRLTSGLFTHVGKRAHHIHTCTRTCAHT